MTREDAIAYFKRHIELYCVDGISREAEEMAIKALEQQPCEDAISREILIHDLQELIEAWKEYPVMAKEIKGVEAALGYVKTIPPVTPQKKMGRWLHREIMDYLDKNKVRHNHFMCQDCGFIHDFVDGHTTQYKYCPSCGAKMQEVEE